LPQGWVGAFVVLVIVFVLSAFLDNIAAALIGGALAQSLFRGRVAVGYRAAIVAAANAGGAGSVIGDATTTMMWIAGVSPWQVIDAYIGGGVALLLCGIPAALMQQRYSPISVDTCARPIADLTRIGIVTAVLVTLIVTDLLINSTAGHRAALFPFIGVAVWIPLLWAAPLRRPDWECVPAALGGALFLLALVFAASMMPVERLPAPTWQSALGLGAVSAVFDNIPLTALSLEQGGYDWGVLAYAVGFGGSMLWFGSSAGVALSNMYPEARSTRRWLRHGWPVIIAYIAGFAVLIWVRGWHPDTPIRAAESSMNQSHQIEPDRSKGGSSRVSPAARIDT
jgi:Na+/H+ antiporter NhaD/arsenite permease-like protein